jgi:chemotaxis protein CheC
LINSFEELTNEHKDVLQEVGNVGAGNAATALGVILDKDVHISVPILKIADYVDAISIVGPPEVMVVAVLIEFSGDAKGIVLFVLSMEDAKQITDILLGSDKSDSDISLLDEMKISAIKEIGNIVGSAYLGAIAELTGMRIEISIPHIAIDMAGAVLAAPITEYGAEDTKLLFVDENFTTGERTLISHAIMFAGHETLYQIVSRLGIDI